MVLINEINLPARLSNTAASLAESGALLPSAHPENGAGCVYM